MLIEIIQRELTYFLYYFEIQLKQILPYYFVGIFLGSIVSVFLKQHIHRWFLKLNKTKLGMFGIIPASILGILSPLCMYGTIPLAASFSRSGVRDDWLAAFMMSSILLNPQLIVYSTALGTTALTIRILSCFLCGITAGTIISLFFKNKNFFNFNNFKEPKNKDTDKNIFIRFVKNVGRNLKVTYFWFFVGIILSVLFQQYVSANFITNLFGSKNTTFGLILSASIGVPLYACGGGTIPLLREWMISGMGMGSVTAFMLTGPSTKITNLGALKIVLGKQAFIYYLGFIMLFSILTGFIINLV